MKCVLDVDGLLTDFVGGACKFHNVPNPYLDERNWGCYLLEELLAMPASDFFGPLDEVFWANLEPTIEFDTIIELVENKFGRQNVCLLTAPIRTTGCLEGKRIWIKKYLPDYEYRFLIGTPKHFCAGPDAVLIDDSDKNIKAFTKNGGIAITFPRPWNSWHHMSKMPLEHLKMALEGVNV